MKAALRNLIIGLALGAAIALIARWIYFAQTPKPPTVAFAGWHAADLLNTSCVSLQKENDRLSRLPVKEKFDQLYYAPQRFLTCQSPAKDMTVNVENRLLGAFAATPNCDGIRFLQGYYDSKDAQQNKDFLRADWRLSLDLVASSQTGDVALESSQWTLSPTSLSGSLDRPEKAASDICAIVKKQNSQ